MFTTKEDTIVAQATPSGKSALSIVRVSGQNLNTLIYSITKKNLLKARYSYLINIYCPKTNQIIDKCIVVYYKGPNSYTGEDMLEISCHGSPAITNKIIKTLIGLNVRIAQRGEFSFRAFINKKIDLIQAESINELINSQANIARNGAIDNIHGALSDSIKKIKKSLINLLMIIEHELDFNDNEITETPINEINKIIQKNIKMISDIKRSTDLVDQTKDGIRVVLFGKPNAGKSKLFNCILDQDKAIVSSVAGTTRDFNEQFIEINNIDICLVDTAGYFKTKKTLDKQGIEKTIEQIYKADILIVVDEIQPKIPSFLKIKIPVILVTNKSDLKKETIKNNSIHTSALTGHGIGDLLTLLSTEIEKIQNTKPKESAVLCSSRQKHIVKSVLEGLININNKIGLNVEMDIIASLSRSIINELEELSGQVYSEDIVIKIFDDFCVGK